LKKDLTLVRTFLKVSTSFGYGWLGEDFLLILKFKDMLRLGRYKHYKGGEYEVIGVAKHSETLEDMVVYRALYGDNQIWVRPLKMFMEDVEIDGQKIPRFEYLGD
jgi:hypothetical protein